MIDQSKFKRIDKSLLDSDNIVRPTISYWQDAWRRLRQNPVAMVGLFLLLVSLVMVVVGPYIRGMDLYAINGSAKFQTPDAEFWFGADALGRDLFSRIWVGARVSLTVALLCTAIQIIVGCAYGATMAYFGGDVDNVMMRIIEIITSMPSLLITLLIMMVLGNSMWALLVAMCITAWCSTARQMRGLIMQLREAEYVMAAEAFGASPYWIITRHLLPNTLSILILNVATSIPTYIFTEASLSFLGMGLQSPEISLGTLIADGQAQLDIYPHLVFFPSLVLCVIVFGFNILGDGLRDALDPKLRQ
ncbi:MAG: diguanylate cyclase [Epulopiscium sp. Nele67-Bin002]|nr:MAG: diguanylate cyclase [Epulopiscium sp. Nele67-Bin002]OON93197.1 MAG: diguanylate cyclase [Epulopiscium sp. Nele67-Bin001]